MLPRRTFEVLPDAHRFPLNREVHEEQIEDECREENAHRKHESNGIRAQTQLARLAHFDHGKDGAHQDAAHQAEHDALRRHFTGFLVHALLSGFGFFSSFAGFERPVR